MDGLAQRQLTQRSRESVRLLLALQTQVFCRWLLQRPHRTSLTCCQLVNLLYLQGYLDQEQTSHRRLIVLLVLEAPAIFLHSIPLSMEYIAKVRTTSMPIYSHTMQHSCPHNFLAQQDPLLMASLIAHFWPRRQLATTINLSHTLQCLRRWEAMYSKGPLKDRI